MQLDGELKQRIEGLIASDRVVLFMKGTRHFPQCGFSATVTQILNKLVPQYATVNVLADAGIREGIKAYSEWPTIPQLYVDGKFIGGCDIVREMFQAGELHSLLGVNAPAPAAPARAPQLSVSPAAQRAIGQAKGEEQGMLRLEVSPDFEHALSIDEPEASDFRVDAGGITVLIDPESAARAEGVRIDYEGGAGGDQGGFRIDNPNEPAKVRPLSATALKSMMDASERFELYDVRTQEERARASIAGARLLDDEAVRHLSGLDKDTPIVFHCHHGGRSQAAAERFVREGFKRVYNLTGGIDAWSTSVDPSVPRY
ncbi:MAG TPA: Grx4 family monothiol glutaredoxin [Polyangiales bacterium]|nr:Grx4 family monothiol glutaredoxin [Polyangiales bacterium]